MVLSTRKTDHNGMQKKTGKDLSHLKLKFDFLFL